MNSNYVTTIEGCPETASIAKETFEELKLQNIDLNIGEFSLFFDQLILEMSKPVFVYIDGNHQYAPTMKYFKYFINHAKDNTILVFDDIYWSSEMKKAWNEIQGYNYFTIDLYKVGIVLLSEKSKPLAIKRRLKLSH